MSGDVKEAKELLESLGYAVIKVTDTMKKAMDECTEDCDCLGCACNICILQMFNGED